MPYCRPAILSDAEQLEPNLRDQDRREVTTLTGEPALQSLIHGIAMSDMPIAIVDDDETVLGLFGVVPTFETPKTGAVWMLASPQLFRHKRRFIRESRQWVEAMQSRYDLLFNVVDERNTIHVRWLKWCGFTFINRHQLGTPETPFLEFVRTKR